MNRKLTTILLLVCLVLLLLGGTGLYRKMTNDMAPIAADEEASDSISAREQKAETEVLQNVSGAAQEEETEAIIGTKDTAADFVMLDRDGNEHRLSEFYGMPVIINFWATWCGPCQMELPYFQQANETYGERIQFIMLDLTDGFYETRETAVSFAEDKGYSFPLFFDELGEGALAYGISAIPLTVVIDENGYLVDQHLGTMSSEELQELIDTILN